MRDTEGRIRESSLFIGILPPAYCLLFLASFLLCGSALSHALDLPEVVRGLQTRYASVQTVQGSFRQTYRAPGIQKEQTGRFLLMKPGLMRWEYSAPEEQLFVADGKETFLYVPRDQQVTIQPFTEADLRSTPLDILLGSGNIDTSYVVSWDTEPGSKTEHTVRIRLVPRSPEGENSFLVLACKPTMTFSSTVIFSKT